MLLAATLAAQLLAAACTDKPATVTNALPPKISDSYLKAHKPKGTVLLTVSVSSNGTPTNIAIKSSTIDDETVVKAAINAARDSKYSPAMHDCRAVAGSYLFKVQFTPDN